MTTTTDADNDSIELTPIFDVEAARDYIREKCREEIRQHVEEIVNELNETYNRRAQYYTSEFEDGVEFHEKTGKAHLGHLPKQIRVEHIIDEFDELSYENGDDALIREAVKAGVKSVSHGWADHAGDVETVYEINED